MKFKKKWIPFKKQKRYAFSDLFLDAVNLGNSLQTSIDLILKNLKKIVEINVPKIEIKINMVTHSIFDDPKQINLIGQLIINIR